MIATIICIILVLLGVFLIVDGLQSDDYRHGEMIFCFGITTTVGAVALMIISLVTGYTGPKHDFTREEVVQALKDNPNSVTIEQARKWNREEQSGNNYFFRFTLRDENLINIDQILLEYVPEDK